MTEPEFTATIRIRPGDELACTVDVPTLEVWVEEGPDQGSRVSRTNGMVRVGSVAGNDLVLVDPAVSRCHLEVRFSRKGIEVRDLGSKNGTFVDGVEVQQAPLGAAAKVRLGSTTLRARAGEVRRRSPIREVERFGRLVGTSPKMRELFSLIEAVADTEVSVLLLGESGTGKELVAHEVHDRSGRAGPLVTFDAGTADPETLRSDLFGHLTGAFTGAAGAREGAFRRAHGGTLFLDEVGELALDLQSRLLRVLETGEVTPMGADKPEVVNVRMVAATHRDLAAMVRAGTFREDLFHRLAVLPISVPPLRDRGDDVLLLSRALSEARGHSLTWTPEAEDRLKKHSWPGNVRALRNLVDRLSVLVRGRPVSAQDVNFGPLASVNPVRAAGPGSVSSVVGGAERQAIEAALDLAQGNRKEAADRLGISLATLKRRLKKYREDDEQF